MMVWMAGAGLMADEPGLEMKNPAFEESPVGNQVADALRQVTKADIAFVAASELRGDLEKSRIFAENLPGVFVQPEDTVAVLSLTGLQILQALERSVSLHPRKNRGFLQVSGLRFTFDPSRPSGERVLLVTVGKEKIKEDSRYRVAMSSTLAGGALGYFKVWDNKKQSAGPSLKTTLEDAVKSFLKEGKERSPAGERIGIKK